MQYQDYTVVAHVGDDALDLRPSVMKAMSQGWVPLGGIHIAGPLDDGTMLFSQAMGLPEGERLSKKFEF
jgi:hypothetical protein